MVIKGRAKEKPGERWAPMADLVRDGVPLAVWTRWRTKRTPGRRAPNLHLGVQRSGEVSP